MDEVASSGSVELIFCSSVAACSNMCVGNLTEENDNRIPANGSYKATYILDSEGNQ